MIKAVFAISLFAVAGQAFSTTGAVGPEFQINTTTADGQQEPKIAINADGSYVVVWVSSNQDVDPDDGATSAGVYGQRYSSTGTPLGGEFRVNTYVKGNQLRPEVAMAADGSFVVVWASEHNSIDAPLINDPDGYGIYAQRYAPDGSTIGEQFLVNTVTEDHQFDPDIAMAADGRFVVVYGQEDNPTNNKQKILAQVFSASGAKVGSEIVVAGQSNSLPRVAMDQTGAFTVVWRTRIDPVNFDIQARRYSSAGVPLDDSFVVNSFRHLIQDEPAIGINQAGNMVIAWESRRTGEFIDNKGIYAQRYAPDGSLLGEEFLVNTFTSFDQHTPTVSVNSTGDFTVAWKSFEQDGSSGGIFARRFDVDGAALGGEFRVNSYTLSNQGRPTVSSFGEGGYIIVWASPEQDGDDFGCFGQRYMGTPPIVEFGQASFEVVEGVPTANMQLTLSEDSSQPVSVDFQKLGGDAISPDDYMLPTPNRVDFTPNQTAAALQVEIVDDELDEFPETLQLQLSNSLNSSIGLQDNATLTIHDNDDPPSVSFAQATSTDGENSGTTSISVVLSSLSAKLITVPFSVVSGTAISPDDYSLSASPLVIPAFSPGASISVQLVDDGLDEPDETVQLAIGTPTNASVGLPDTHTLTITDQSEMPSVAFTTSSQVVDEGAGQISATVRLSTVSGFDVNVQFSIGGTAGGGDYSITPTSLVTIPVGSTQANILLDIEDDLFVENDETIELALTSADHASLGAIPNHVITINDNDQGSLPGIACPTELVTTDCDIAANSVLKIRGDKKLVWKWKGAFDPNDLGSPENTNSHVYCLYVDRGLVSQHQIAPGDGWTKKSNKTKFVGKQGVSDEVKKLLLKVSDKGGVVKLKTGAKNLPDLPLTPDNYIIAQLLNEAGLCLLAYYEIPLLTDDGLKAKARTP